MGTCCCCAGEAFETRYFIAEQLGKGSQGKVHACTERETGRKCAVKVIDRSSRNAWTTFRREVDACRRAQNCPFVINIQDEFVGIHACYIVMPKYACHLRKALKATSRLPGSGVGLENTALRRIVTQAMTALAHLYSLEIVHRDVKAQNFLSDRLDLRDPDCQIALADFGLARELPIGHHLTEPVGTRKYWAPDVYKKKYWHNVDVFAIGVLIFLAGSGTYPFNSEEESVNRDVFEEGCCPLILVDEAQDFMRLCLLKDPYARPSAMEMLARPWLAPAQADKCSAEEESSCTNINHESESVTTGSPACTQSSAASPRFDSFRLKRSTWDSGLPVEEAEGLLPSDAAHPDDALPSEKGSDMGETSVVDASPRSCSSRALDATPVEHPADRTALLSDMDDQALWHYSA
mmetsp:Transcript_120290/g.347632  ORF Transcript_120290/g.347632 Transcript_120290/m.347632 type:complete len:406 (-) Transcript_120290:438-1655(-)